MSVPFDVVFHGSGKKKINVFVPKSVKERGSSEGPVVFASPSLKVASCFLIEWTDSWVTMLVSRNDLDRSHFEVNLVISDADRFIREDTGGSIYLLPSKGFTYKKEIGLGIFEWAKKSTVKPFGQIDFNSSVEAMRKFGVKLHFMNQEQYKYFVSLNGKEQSQLLRRVRRSIKERK